MSVSIETINLTKCYGTEKVPALQKLNLQVNSGEVYGYLGANGAGKSTTIRLLLNFLKPTSGNAKILGYDSVSNSALVKKYIGYLAGEVALYKKTTGKQFLDYMSGLQPATAYRKVLEERFEAELDKPISALSKGNRQKLGIIQAFMHEPEVLILDEPTSGLDPLMQEVFYQLLQETKQRGAAVLMSSHNLDEAQRVCDRIGIIKKGLLVQEHAINGNFQLNTLNFKVTFKNRHDREQCLQSRHLKPIHSPAQLTVVLQPTGSIQEALKELGHYDIQAFDTQSLDLENEFLESYGNEQ